MTPTAFDESLQEDLLQGFDLPDPHLLGSTEAADAQVQLPVARVYIDSHLPQVDRLFDYRVPAALDQQAQPGVRVRVKFNGQELSGWLKERCQSSDSPQRLLPLEEVLSELTLLTPEIFALAETLADRYAALISDILRKALPARVVGVEKPYLEAQQSATADQFSPEELEETEADLSAFNSYLQGPEFCEDLLAGEPARAVLTLLPAPASHPWEEVVAQALIATASRGRSALALVPDYKKLDSLTSTLERLAPGAYARLTGADRASDRYRNFLDVRFGRKKILIGTRSAAYAPLENLGLLVCFDDGDSSYLEPSAPYCHARDILLLRARDQKAAALFLGYSVSSESARLVRTGWASLLRPERQLLRASTPRVLTTGDDYQLAQDPLAAIARIPHLAFQVAQEALERGPVLIQVARAGYLPALSCQRCYMPARCQNCQGPIGFPAGSSAPQCSWCGKLAQPFRCQDCGYQAWRNGLPGALRTAEELGRAFPERTVITSSGENIKTTLGPEPALVVATPGAEPAVEGGYSAALLLDADRMLHFDSLRAPEAALRRWLNAASLVRPYHQGGRVVTTASPSAPLEALIRWDPYSFASWELDERYATGLPPASRSAAITGSQEGVAAFLAALDIPADVRQLGPVPLEDSSGYFEGKSQEPLYRAIFLFSYSRAQTFTHHLRAVKASQAALRRGEPVQIRCDGLDIL